jgi:hypothetical protein
LRQVAGAATQVPSAADAQRWLSRISRIDVTRHLLDRAGDLDAVVRAADAIHIATAIDLAPRFVIIATHDGQMARAITTLRASYPTSDVIDPVTDDEGRGPVA